MYKTTKKIAMMAFVECTEKPEYWKTFTKALANPDIEKGREFFEIKSKFDVEIVVECITEEAKITDYVYQEVVTMVYDMLLHWYEVKLSKYGVD